MRERGRKGERDKWKEGGDRGREGGGRGRGGETDGGDNNYGDFI